MTKATPANRRRALKCLSPGTEEESSSVGQGGAAMRAAKVLNRLTTEGMVASWAL
jgi:hypothetical protein